MVFKVVYKGTTYVFIGSLKSSHPDLVERLVSDKGSLDDLEAALGYKIHLTKQNTTKFVSTAIRNNDTVATFVKKVCIELGIKSIDKTYFWYHRKVKGDPSFIYHFISQVFRKSKLIQYQTFLKAASTIGYTSVKDYNMISKAEASRLLFEEASLDKIAEALCFHYGYDGYMEYFNADPSTYKEGFDDVSSAIVDTSPMSMLLSSMNIHRSTVYLHIDGPELYFPFRNKKTITEDDKKLLAALEDMENNIDKLDITSTKIKSLIHHVHIKGNDVAGINGHVDLETFFNNLSTSSDILFIKFKTPLNVYYKIHKESLTKITPDDITKWTKLPSVKDDKSFVIVKGHYNNGSCMSIHINSDLSFQLKTSIGIKEGESVSILSKRVAGFLNAVLNVLNASYPNSYVPIDCPDNILVKSSPKDIIRVVQLLSSTTIQSLDAIDYSLLPIVIQNHMYPYFNIVKSPDPSMLQIQYKKVNNYSKLDNISSFVIMNSYLPKEDLVSQVINTFFISREDAEREVEGALTSITSEDIKKNARKAFYEQLNNFVNIRIRVSNPIELKYMVNGGMTDGETIKEIDILMAKLLAVSKQTLKKKTSIGSSLEKLETKIEQKAPVDTEPVVVLPTDEDDDNDSSLEGLDEDLLALQMEFETAPMPAAVVENAVTTQITDRPAENTKKTGKVKGYVLSKLYEADKQLFEYKPPPDVKRRDYASLCGWVDRRQPVVVTKDELDKIEKEFPGAINGHVRSGSTLDLQKKNHYICPKIWCPKSRVALSHEDYVKHGNKCPYPEIDEEPILFASKSFFGEGETGLKRQRYPGYLDKYIHPDQLCLPCCFKVKPSEGNRNKQRGDMCVLKEEKEEEPIAAIEGPVEKYIKGANYSPLEVGRFGLLPPALSDFLQQTTSQGNRHDGTGSITDNTDAMFRQGIPQDGQSYLDTMVIALDNDQIQTSTDLINKIVENLDVLTYVSLESGRIMKMFVDTSKTLYDHNALTDFYKWFKKQKRYILHMNLQKLLVELEKGDLKHVDALKHHHEILREYIIYQSFHNFLDYLKNDRVKKDHIVLGDLICNHMHKHINVNKHNIVLLDYDVENDKIYITCNVNKHRNYDYDYPFVFLWKRHAYYEPLVHVQQREGVMNTAVIISSGKLLTRSLKQIVDFSNKNCNRKPLSDDLINTINYLKTIDFKIKYYVIDYGYKLCGFILNHNLYVPLKDREELYYHHNIRYVYINEVPNFRCLLDIKDIKAVYDKLCKHSSKFSNISSILEDGSGVTLENGAFVPLNIKKADERRIVFDKGLLIMVGIEKEDKRSEMQNFFVNEAKVLEDYARTIQAKMVKDIEFAKEIKFLTDKHNPLPLKYKQIKLLNLLGNERVASGLAYKLLEYLKTSSQHFKMYKRRIRRFPVKDHELFLDHADVQAGRLRQAIELAENPHKAFLHVLDKQQAIEHIFGDVSNDKFEDVLGMEKEDVPVKWRKILRGFKVVDNQKAYHSTYMLDIMKRISARGGRTGFTEDLYKALITRKVIDAYKQQVVGEIFENPWLTTYFKKTKLVQSLDNVFEVYTSSHYHPSVFDVKVMAQLCNVNLVVIGRKTTKNPDGIEVVHNGSDIWVLLCFAFERHLGFDRFSLYVKDDDIYFTTNKLPREFVDIITKKMYEYNVNVIDDEGKIP